MVISEEDKKKFQDLVKLLNQVSFKDLSLKEILEHANTAIFLADFIKRMNAPMITPNPVVEPIKKERKKRVNHGD
jgi:hypothetical protein